MENDSTSRAHLEMQQWVIYRHPRDYPDKYVARLWGVWQGEIVATDEMALAETLQQIRRMIPPGLYCLGRFEDDDPCILEVWI